MEDSSSAYHGLLGAAQMCPPAAVKLLSPTRRWGHEGTVDAEILHPEQPVHQAAAPVLYNSLTPALTWMR